MTNWNEQKPTSSDLVSELPSVLTSNAIAFRTGVEKHSYWTDSSGVSAGQTRFSDGSFGPGSFRAFFDAESSLSTALSTVKPLSGRLYVASDTKRLYGFTSAGTVPLGGRNVIAYLGASAATIQSNVRTLIQIGSLSSVPGSSTITYPTAYAVAPVVQITVMSSGTTHFGIAKANVVGTATFSSSLSAVYGDNSAMTILWKSTGTVAL
jgi:hypothetical protein